MTNNNSLHYYNCPCPVLVSSPLLVVVKSLSSLSSSAKTDNKTSINIWRGGPTAIAGLYIIMEIYGLLLCDVLCGSLVHPWRRRRDKGCRFDIIRKGVRIVSCNRFDCRWSCEAVISLPIHPSRRFTYFDCPHIKFVDNVMQKETTAESVLSRLLRFNNAINSPVVRILMMWELYSLQITSELWMTFQFARSSISRPPFEDLLEGIWFA